MSNLRKAITIYDEDIAMTLLKPISEEHKNRLIVIHENAYGELSVSSTPIVVLRENFGGSDDEFNKILNDLEL